ncbi:MAG: alpha/beta hydrolase [Deltaproteobacteria bacterium]|nr:MAG: alpha/beta hydrolase [Deltaproteobacteria bacterium]
MRSFSKLKKVVSIFLFIPVLVTNIAFSSSPVHQRMFKVSENLEISYREAGDPTHPTVLLLHGFPTSSHMFRNLIPALATDFHVLAPDYPGYGNSSQPAREDFTYSFANFADLMEKFIDYKKVNKFAVYLMDYGAPVGFRLFAKNPSRVSAFIIQNGNAYDEGLLDFWDPIKKYWNENTTENRNALRGLLTLGATKWQYTHGTEDVTRVSSDNWFHDQYLLDREGNNEIQLDMFYDYRTNVALYPKWQKLFRSFAPPTLIVWGKNDVIFPEAGAHPYKKDIKDLETHILNTGHFALEEKLDEMVPLIRSFLFRKLSYLR